MSDNDTSEIQKREEELSFPDRNGWEGVEDDDELHALAEDYKEFLAEAKTEREAVQFIREEAEAAGFVPLEDLDEYEAGDRVYAVNRDKMIVLAKLGSSLEDMRMTISHVDSPRLDLKQRPLYEDSGLGMMDTHYYGGIRKYQWFNVPLALHGTVIDGDGESHTIVIGEDEDDPVFLAPDLLPHLAGDQKDKTMDDAIDAEHLDLVVGNIPVDDEDIKEGVKLRVLQHLDDEYDLTETDLVSAEFEAVPAHDPRDCGLDRSMVAAYGQDDRGLAFTTYRALLDTTVDRTAMACFFDREEIGSQGNTAAESQEIERVLAELLDLREDTSTAGLYRVLSSAEVLSTDVAPAVNPNHKDKHDAKNAINLGEGVALVKFTGSGGKYRASEATAEFLGTVRNMLDAEDIPWKPVELGKVDRGGGGTVAKFMANRGADVLDLGFALVSMHSPCEISSKADVYQTYRACSTFFGADQ